MQNDIMNNRQGLREIPFSGNQDVLAVTVIAIYCLSYFLLRMLAPSSMQLDESEQFIRAFVPNFIAVGQPPLYTWLVKAASAVTGKTFFTIIFVKYVILFIFYICFYLIARQEWDPVKSLLITSSLLLIGLFSYEFVRDLSHTILACAIGTGMCLSLIRVGRSGSASSYIMFGALSGLGLMAKNNFVLLLFAAVVSALTIGQWRRALFSRKIFLSIAIFSLVSVLHLHWLAGQGFQPIAHAMNKSGSGALDIESVFSFLHLIPRAFIASFVFVFLFWFFYRGNLSLNAGQPHEDQLISFFRRLGISGHVAVLVVIFILRPEIIKGRWLAPVLFTLPLAMFTVVDLRRTAGRNMWLARLTLSIAIIFFIVRGVVSFFPDIVHPKRIHIPFESLSAILVDTLSQRGVRETDSLVVLSDNMYLPANVMRYVRFGKFVHCDYYSRFMDGQKRKDMLADGGLLLWDATVRGNSIPASMRGEFPDAQPLGIIISPYLHSSRQQFALGAALIGRH
jgi:4-amino-4-deoxy-L-arabinose transferase-like glycosyltransferase